MISEIGLYDNLQKHIFLGEERLTIGEKWRLLVGTSNVLAKGGDLHVRDVEDTACGCLGERVDLLRSDLVVDYGVVDSRFK